MEKFDQSIPVQAGWVAEDVRHFKIPAGIKLISKHDRVINLKVKDWPYLLVISALDAKGPATIGVDKKSFRRLLACLRAHDEGGFVPAGELTFPREKGTLILKWSNCPTFSFAVPGYLTGEVSAVEHSVLRLIKWLKKEEPLSAGFILFGLDNGERYFVDNIKFYFPLLVQSLFERQPESFRDAFQRLVGLGRGSTPTGDDLVYGMMIAAHYLRKVCGRGFPLPAYPEDFHTRTTALGAHMLALARRGLAPEPVQNFLISVFQGKPCYEKYKEVCRLGASSGFDMLCGMVFTLSWFVRHQSHYC